jgi:large subunit ribosomal protein L22
MAFIASHRFARISPRKVRLMADIVRGKLADEALELLRYQPQRGARMLEKVIRSALANAEDQRAQNINTLVLTDVRVDGGPMLKRMMPRARGMASVIKRRMSHIRVSLE